MTVDIDGPARVFEKRPVPTARFQAPRTDKYASLYDHRPDADEAMWLATGTNAQNLPSANTIDDVGREALLFFHFFRLRIAEAVTTSE